jgi:hypothetical protein
VDAVFFGEIWKISKYWAQTDSMGSWFTLALNSPKLQSSHKGGQGLVSGNLIMGLAPDTDVQDDIAHTINKNHAEVVEQARERGIKASNARSEYMSSHLSTLTMSQLNVQVSQADYYTFI